MNEQDYRYPIGQYESQPFSMAQKTEWLADIKFLPDQVEAAVATLTDEQLDTPYRDGGWTVRQVVHHLADSHINAYCRFKLSLTEINPTIRPYDENGWAAMNDARTLPISFSLSILQSLHARMYKSLQYIIDEDWNNRSVFHPANQKQLSLWALLGLYAWHGKHHTAHITKLSERMKW